jgi:hypothetical protein
LRKKKQSVWQIMLMKGDPTGGEPPIAVRQMPLNLQGTMTSETYLLVLSLTVKRPVPPVA